MVCWVLCVLVQQVEQGWQGNNEGGTIIQWIP